MNYYYLAASLPALSLDTAPPMGMEAFELLCGEHLRPADMEALVALRQAEDSPHPFVRAWHQVETQLRNTIAAVRARRTNREGSGYMRNHDGFEASVEKIVNDAFSAPTPLERERILDSFRWSQAEDLSGYNDFSGSALLGYGIRLMLAQRWAVFNVEAGRETLESMVSASPKDKIEDSTPGEDGRQTV